VLRHEQSSRPSVMFDSGKIGEGSYQFFFAAAEGRRSPPGRLSIAFDNSARTASVAEPLERAARAGDKIAISGTALARSRVTVSGAPVPIDAQGRFKTEVAAPAYDDAVAIRVEHSATKVHYYVRHLTSTSP